MSQSLEANPGQPPSEATYCDRHPQAPAIGRCIDCDHYICEACHSREEGYLYCPACTQRRSAGLDQNTVLIFWMLLGGLGGHRFYTGHILIGMLQLFTLGGLGIWTFYDLYLILTGRFKDDEGRLLIDRS